MVQFPNKEALEAIQEIPTYHTVEIPKPSIKEEDEKILSHSREDKGEKISNKGEEEKEKEDDESHPGVSSKGEEGAHAQKDDDEPHEYVNHCRHSFSLSFSLCYFFLSG